MNLNKFLKLSLGIFFALPTSIFFGNEMLANHLVEKIDYEIKNDNLLACGGGGGGGGGGGSSPAARKAKKAKKAKAKLNFKKRQLAKMAAAGEATSDLQAEIEQLEKELEDLK